MSVHPVIRYVELEPEAVVYEPNALRGRISREFTVWCATCEKWCQEPAPTMVIARWRFRQAGWRYTRKRGWRCRSCCKPPKKVSGPRGMHGLRTCKGCGEAFVAEWPGSEYCPRCPARSSRGRGC